MGKHRMGLGIWQLTLKSLLLLVLLCAAGAAAADAQAAGSAASPLQLRVVATGAVTTAVNALAPLYEQQRHIALKLEYGGSMGTGATSIPAMVDRGEVIDVVILWDSPLDDLIHRGKVAPGS